MTLLSVSKIGRQSVRLNHMGQMTADIGMAASGYGELLFYIYLHLKDLLMEKAHKMWLAERSAANGE